MKRPSRSPLLLVLASAITFGVAAEARAGDEPSPVLAADKLGVSWQQTLPSQPAHREISRKAGLRLMSLCPNCPPSNITDGHCYWSRITRVVMLNAAVQGKTEAELVDTYLSIYGPTVLAVGTENGFAMMSWIVPYVAVTLALLGLLVLATRLKRRQKKREAELPKVQPDQVAQSILQHELDALDT